MKGWGGKGGGGGEVGFMVGYEEKTHICQSPIVTRDKEIKGEKQCGNDDVFSGSLYSGALAVSYFSLSVYTIPSAWHISFSQSLSSLIEFRSIEVTKLLSIEVMKFPMDNLTRVCLRHTLPCSTRPLCTVVWFAFLWNWKLFKTVINIFYN